MTSLEIQILCRLADAKKIAPLDRILAGITATRHHSRARLCLEDMQRRGLVVSDDDLRWQITIGGRKSIRDVKMSKQPKKSAEPKRRADPISKKAWRILGAAKTPMTKGELAQAAGVLSASSVSATVMVWARAGLVKSVGARACAVTGFRAKTWARIDDGN